MRKAGSVMAMVFLAAALWAEVPATPPGEQPLAAAVDSPSLAGMLGTMVIVETNGGGEFRGSLFLVLDDRIELLDGEGRIVAIARAALVSIEEMDEARDLSEYFQDSAANRLILMPTGFGMEAGEFHVAAQEVVVITTSYGISPHLSAWCGISIPGAVVNLRYSSALGEAGALSLGSFVGASWFDPLLVVLPYAIVSFGNPNRNLTIGGGVPLAWSAEVALRPIAAVLAIGGKIIVSATASIVTENWICAYSDSWAWGYLDLYVFPAAVFRIAGSRLSWDIGATVPLIISNRGGAWIEGSFGGTVIPIPILSVTYRID